MLDRYKGAFDHLPKEGLYGPLPETLNWLQICQSIDELLQAYSEEVIAPDDTECPFEYRNWRVLGFGGDTAKVIAISRTDGVMVKKYFRDPMAWLVGSGYELLKKVDNYGVQLVMPLGFYKSALIYPLLDVVNSCQVSTNPLLTEAINQLNTPLSPASRLVEMQLSSGVRVYTDPFSDSINDLDADLERIANLGNY